MLRSRCFPPSVPRPAASLPPCFPREEEADLIDHTPVILLGLAPHAGTHAFPDVEIEAFSLRTFIRQTVRTRSDGKNAPKGFQCRSHLRGCREWPEILCTILFDFPGHENSRERFIQGYFDRGIFFIILEIDIVSRFVFLDQVCSRG